MSSQVAEVSALLQTKLYQPPVQADLVPRPRLFDQLNAHWRDRPLTLISAPAGYGKSVLASMWLKSCDNPSCWVSLDEKDNDLRVFTAYLLAAVKRTFPDILLQSQALLETATPLSAPMIARHLLNDLDQIKTPFLLALDDVHLLTEPAVFELLDEWLRHPPQALHLVLISRHDPPLQIVSLRASNRVTEIRDKDLRFTVQETRNLMNRMLNREIDRSRAAEWTQRTEGWVTALRLAVISMRHSGRENGPLIEFDSENRYLREYLLGEVLSSVKPRWQANLLKISILDRFCPSLYEYLCAVEQTTDASCHDSLEFFDWMQRENLFLVPLDDKREWFRFHHLFQENLQEMLRIQQSTDEINGLYQRAATWCAQSNLLDEALQYALVAKDIKYAAQLIEQHRYSLMNTEQWNRLDRWLKRLPEEFVAQCAPLLSARAYVALFRGEDQEMLTSVQQADRLLANLPPHAAERQIVQAEIDVIQSVVDNLAGQVTRSMARAKNSMQVLPSDALFVRMVAIGGLLVGHQMQGEFRQGMVLFRKVNSDHAWPVSLRPKLMHLPCIACFQEGDLIGVLEWGQQAIQIAEEHHLIESISEARHNVGVTHYLRNEFAQAETHLIALLEDRNLSAPNYLAMGVIALALIYLAQNRLSEVEQVIDLTIAHFRETEATFALANMEAFRVELALRRGNLVEAQRLSRHVEFNIRSPIWFFYVPQFTSIKLLQANGTESRLAEARSQLEVLAEEMHKLNRKNVLLDALALLALVCAAQGDGQAAQKNLQMSLELGKAGGNIRSFADLGTPMADLLIRFKLQQLDREVAEYIDQILEAFQEGTRLEIVKTFTPNKSVYPSQNARLSEPLTLRELQVLKLLATEMSTKEIAGQLAISYNTLRVHIKIIYRKLEVHKRVEAVQIAWEKDLI